MQLSKHPVGTRLRSSVPSGRWCVCNTRQTQQHAGRLLSLAQQQHASVAAATAQQRNLVVAVDHTEGTYTALKWTLEHLYRDGDVLHLLHVVPAASSVTCCGGFDLASTLPPEEVRVNTLAKYAMLESMFTPHQQPRWCVTSPRHYFS
eukprot:GHRQ01014757.1.p2 GENE.GHRQ01014757.1~~GHRQ01014757.1.p2  ORF type:complete len:148 (-),score=26.17 GHRQ01014757.1:1416-1859(-)